MLLTLLPQIQRKLDVNELKPHLKLSCSLTEEECKLLFKCGQNTSKKNDNVVHVLVKLLRQKNPHYCARMLLDALKQSAENSSSAIISGHMEIIDLLEAELKIMSEIAECASSNNKGRIMFQRFVSDAGR